MLWWIFQQLRVSNQKTRLTVVQKLAESDSPDAVETFIFALKDRAPEVRLAAARALAKFHDPQSVGPLMQLLRDEKPEVRAAAAEALGKQGDPLAVNSLVGLLVDKDQAVRGTVSRSLEKLGWRPGDDSQRVMQILAMGRTSAAVSLGAEAVEPLAEMARSGPPNEQFEAIKALGEIDDPRVKAVMLEVLKKENPALRIAVLGTLERLADPATLPALEKILADSHAGVRGAVVEAMASCGRQKAVPALLRMLMDSSWEVRLAVVRALGSIADTSAVDGVAALLKDTDRDVRESAVVALGRIGDRRAVPALVLALLDVESLVRAAATGALPLVDRQWTQNPSVRLVLPQVKDALSHSEYWVRHSATRLFAQLQVDPETVKAAPAPAAAPLAEEPAHPAFGVLADMLFDHDRDLRLAAVEAFRHLLDRNALVLLAPAMQDSDRNVQLAVRRTMAALE